MSKNIFIFVVCGAKEHVDTLHFSMYYLKKYSKNEIWVLTDSTRNETPVEHEQIIDIKTPEQFDHHQASIYLKTGIHQFVPKGNNYCYLDTDIIAVSTDVDLIFKEFITPIIFAPDHCVLDKFSAYAVNCECQEKWKRDRDKFNAALIKYDKNISITDPRLKESARDLQRKFAILKQDPKKKILTALRYLFSYPTFHFNSEYSFNRNKRVWVNAQKEIVMYEVKTRKIEKETGFKYSRLKQNWLNEKGEDLWRDQCPHLKEYISEKFGVEVKNAEFQHWNGGVFLFNDSSHEFLSAWFNYTMEVFKDSNWKTRDQGTLIATVWKFDLQNHATLDKKWNLIADYHNPYLSWTQDDKIQLSAKEFVKANLIHVYHHFGDENWAFWNQLMEHSNEEQ